MKLFLILMSFSFIASAQTLEDRVRNLEAKVRRLERQSPNMAAHCFCRPLGGDDFRPVFVDRAGTESDLGLGHGPGQWCMATIQQNAACAL